MAGVIPPTLRLEDFGLPSRAELASYRIWDSYYHPASTRGQESLHGVVAELLEIVEPFAIERLCTYFHVGLGTLRGGAAAAKVQEPEEIRRVLEAWPERALGFLMLNARDVAGSLGALERWVRKGPMAGVMFLNSPGCLPCTHPNFQPIVERAAELGALIVQHTWFKAGGREFEGESTPSDLAVLAARNPKINFVCAHAGGDWEKGLRAVRAFPNIAVETSGFDPTHGFIEMAVRELGAERIVFGGHLPSRSIATEFSKILSAEISEEDRRLIFGGNLRRLLERG